MKDDRWDEDTPPPAPPKKRLPYLVQPEEIEEFARRLESKPKPKPKQDEPPEQP
jgi:hypothetical protein